MDGTPSMIMRGAPATDRDVSKNPRKRVFEETQNEIVDDISIPLNLITSLRKKPLAVHGVNGSFPMSNNGYSREETKCHEGMVDNKSGNGTLSEETSRDQPKTDEAVRAVESLKSFVNTALSTWHNNPMNTNLNHEDKRLKLQDTIVPIRSFTTSAVKVMSKVDCLSDDDNSEASSTTSAKTGNGNGKPDTKRVERNAREKDRSLKISNQIHELRCLLTSGGVIVPKGTKSSILTEAANYIRMLQEHQYRSEIDRQQLIHQIQKVGAGSCGPPATEAIRHAAAQNGIWSLGNFGGLPPHSSPATSQIPQKKPPEAAAVQVVNVEDQEYRNLFNSCSVGMAIASLGGAFIDCNRLFLKFFEYSKQELCAMTIFNLISRTDLQDAFDQISQMISPRITDFGEEESPAPSVPDPGNVFFRAKSLSDDIGLRVALLTGEEDSVAKGFCVTLVKVVSSPSSKTRLIPCMLGDLENTIETPFLKEGADLSSNQVFATAG